VFRPRSFRAQGDYVKKRFTVKQLIAGVCCCIAAISATLVRAQDRTKLEKDLRTTYQDKLLSLKNPYFGSKLQFDSSGTLVGKEVAGPWSTCGLVHVDKLILAPDHLEIDGKRVILALRSEESSPSDVHVIPLVTGNRVRIVVELSPVDVPQVNKVLSQVFQAGQLLERVAAYWKPKTADLKSFRASTPNAIIGELEGNRPVYLVNPGVVDRLKRPILQTPSTRRWHGKTNCRALRFC
jgi:hypothetical protein